MWIGVPIIFGIFGVRLLVDVPKSQNFPDVIASPSSRNAKLSDMCSTSEYSNLFLFYVCVCVALIVMSSY